MLKLRNKGDSRIVSEKQRQSNIELLRIICMLMIIGAHFMYHNNAITETSGIKQWFACFVSIGGKVGFDCFIVISSWFLINSKFKAERFVKIWLQVLFYNVVFLLAAIVMGKSVGVRESFAAIFPITGSSHAYAGVYLIWYLLLPVFHIVQKNISNNQLKYLLIVLGIGLVGAETVAMITSFTQNVSLISNNLLLFTFVYFLMLYLYNLKIDWNKYKRISLAIFICVYTYMAGLLIIRQLLPSNQIFSILSRAVFNERSVLNILAGLCLFSFAMGCRVTYNKSINFIAMSTFGVLLFHDHNYFRSVVWEMIIVPSRWFSSSTTIFIIAAIITVISIFLAGVIIDTARRVLLEKRIMNLKAVKFICSHFNDFIYHNEEK